MMAPADKSSRPAAPKLPAASRSKGLPWLTIAAVAVVLLLAGAITFVVVDKSRQNDQVAAGRAEYTPTLDDRDPSTKIPGIYIGARTDNGPDRPFDYPSYKALLHVNASERVAYDRFPPVGGPHDAQWADCQGIVYTTPVRDENMVHTLEHGAVWIAYNPTTVTGDQLTKLQSYVTGQNYITLTPYPTLKANISLQAWAHQLQVSDANDPRIDQFITALRQNQYVYPETGARCDSPGWDSANPPAFDGSPRTATDVKMDGSGAVEATDENGTGTSGSGEPSASGSAEPSASGSGSAPATESGSAPATESGAPATSDTGSMTTQGSAASSGAPSSG